MSTAAVPSICLASASPRRRELLRQLGVAHIALATHVDEAPAGGESPRDYVRRLALNKATAAASDAILSRGLPALGADTAVVIDGRILGKPADESEACAMLAALSGRGHEVLSAVALRGPHGVTGALSVTQVWFRPILPEEAHRYWRSAEPVDKSGGYAIQGLAAAFVQSIRGSYSGVVGLPLFETAQLLTAAGISVWQGVEQ